VPVIYWLVRRVQGFQCLSSSMASLEKVVQKPGIYEKEKFATEGIYIK
jgi:hypothetical protein